MPRLLWKSKGGAVSYERSTPVQLFAGFVSTNFGQIVRADIDEFLKSRAFDFPKNHHEADLGCPVASNLSGRGTTRAEDAQGTPTQRHISPSILVYKYKNLTTAMPPVGPLVVFGRKRGCRGEGGRSDSRKLKRRG